LKFRKNHRKAKKKNRVPMIVWGR
jgi:hypothetical protein